VTTDPAAIVETRFIHQIHRQATTLLARAAGAPTAPIGALAELRDFLVAALHHHHETEDDLLWPSITAADPSAGAGLADLSGEHDLLDAALDDLAIAPLRGDADRPGLAIAAEAVRGLVHRHLDHEEPILFPALRAHMPDEAWTAFSRTVIASAPPDGAHLMIGFMDRVGTPADLDLVTANLPEPVRQMLPAMRAQARVTLNSLQSAAGNSENGR